MTNILTNALQFGQELTPGVFTMQADDLSHLTFLESATGSIGGDPQGESFKIRVNYRDKSISTEWEIMWASYDDNGGTISMERNVGGTIYSSNGGAPVDFSSAGAGELVILGTFSDEEFKNYNHGDQFSSTAYTSTTNTPIFGSRMSDDLIVSPTGENTKLFVHYNGEALIWNNTGTTASNLRGLCRLEWFDGAAWNGVGLSARFGWFGPVLNPGIQFRFITPYIARLTSSQVNANGDWQVRLSGNPDADTITLTYDGASFIYEESAE